MQAEPKTHPVASLFALASASVLAAGIVVLAPEVSAVTLGILIAAWAALGAVRFVILLGFARQFLARLQLRLS
jgi:hypothetical protein